MHWCFGSLPDPQIDYCMYKLKPDTTLKGKNLKNRQIFATEPLAIRFRIANSHIRWRCNFKGL